MTFRRRGTFVRADRAVSQGDDHDARRVAGEQDVFRTRASVTEWESNNG